MEKKMYGKTFIKYLRVIGGIWPHGIFVGNRQFKNMDLSKHQWPIPAF